CGIETQYGRVAGQSVNGTGALAETLRASGHAVRTSGRLNDPVAAWAQTIVRFAPYPGPPEKAEADWYQSWLSADRSHRLIYVVRDFDAEAEYWDSVIQGLPAGHDPRLRTRYEQLRNA